MTDNIITRHYNKLNVDYVRGIVTKSSGDSKIEDEIRYYITAQEYGFCYSYLFPRLIDYNLDSTPEKYLQIEWYNYQDLGKAYVRGEHSIDEWYRILEFIKFISDEWKISAPVAKLSYNGFATGMYINKTVFYYERLKKQLSHQYDSLFSFPSLTINEKSYVNFSVLLPVLRTYVLQNISPTTKQHWGIIHGDMCLSNILYGGEGTIRFIDPRGSFGERGIYGDTRYDIAKLWHSVYGEYDLLNHDLFRLIHIHPSVWSMVLFREEKFPIQDVIKHYFREIFFNTPEFETEIMVITGLLFVSAASRHAENVDRQIALYLTGIKLLNEGLDKVTLV